MHVQIPDLPLATCVTLTSSLTPFKPLFPYWWKKENSSFQIRRLLGRSFQLMCVKCSGKCLGCGKRWINVNYFCLIRLYIPPLYFSLSYAQSKQSNLHKVGAQSVRKARCCIFFQPLLSGSRFANHCQRSQGQLRSNRLGNFKNTDFHLLPWRF